MFKSFYADISLGTRIKFKCHQPIQRIEQTLHGEKCTNWKVFDSFGVRLPDFDDSINHTHDYKNFYHNLPFYWDYWNFPFLNYTIVNHRSFAGEKGFILKNGTFERFEPIGITWDDSYCRRITDAGPSGCFVERDLSAIPDFNYQENNCSG